MKNFRQLQEELKPQGTVRVQWDELDMTNIGADVASRIPEDDGPHTYGIGDAKNFVTTADPSSVVNQQNSEGNREFNMSVAPKKSGKPFKTLRGGRIKLHPEDLTGAVADVSIGEEVETMNELSDKKRAQYMKKAGDEVSDSTYHMGHIDAQASTPEHLGSVYHNSKKHHNTTDNPKLNHASWDDLEKHVMKRRKGIETAASKMKEAVMSEAKDKGEYDYEGEMAMTQLRIIIKNAQELMNDLTPEQNLPEWVQNKITLAEDYITTAYNYVCNSVDESVTHPFDKNFMKMNSEEFVAEIIYKQTRNGKLRKERPSVVDSHNKEIETKKKGMKEEVEVLDELSSDLKNRYIKKARKSQASLLDKADKSIAMASVPNGMKQAKHLATAKTVFKKSTKRMVGVVRARASMMGEDVHDWKEEARHLRLREKIEHGMSLLKPVAAHKKAYEYYPKADKSGLPKASIQQYVGEGSAMGALTRKFGDRADAKIAGPRDSVGRLLPKGTSFDDYLKASSDHTIDGRKQKWTHRLPNSASANQHQEYKKFSERTRAEAKEAKAAAQAAERKAIDDRREARNKKKSNTTKGK